ncbi:MAG: transposase [Magnetococcales bacterium]|nr:transposase [Magnetococcales bacterium]
MAGLYPASLGRPNVPVAILVSLSVLKEMFDLTDEALMGSLHFDMRYHYALDLTLEETGLSPAHVSDQHALVPALDDLEERGIESVNAELKTAHGLAKVWTRGLLRVAFAVRMKALACNVKRFLRYSCARLLEKSPEMAQKAA